MNIGKYNTLKVQRMVDFGVYLADENNEEVLLPARYVDPQTKIGNMVEVFVYKDSDDRIVATTEHPKVEINQFGVLKVKAVNTVGAFMDWGLMKDLLVPFREQKVRMQVGRHYPVYVYLDDVSKRIVASGKIEKFLGNVMPDLKRGQRVSALVLRKTDIGFMCSVCDLYQGMVYANKVYENIIPGQRLEAWVQQVRPDGKIDLTLTEPHSGRERSNALADKIMQRIKENGRKISLTDKSSPDEIKHEFQCSKRDFKQAVGHLLKAGKIELCDLWIAERKNTGFK